PAVLGRTVMVNDVAHTVVGVMPPRFAFPALAEAWVPLAPLDHVLTRDDRRLDVLARLRPGVSEDQTRAELAAFASRQAALYPAVETGWEATLRPLRDEMVNGNARLFFATLLGAVMFVLLIACANVANLQLARATDRQREMAVRLAFGAGRGRIVRQLLTESVLLGVLGGAGGVALAYCLGDVLIALLPPTPFPIALNPQPDWRVLTISLVIAISSGIIFGLAPALKA